MNNGDIVLLLVLVAAFIVGFVWGTARSLIFLGGGALVFIMAAHARGPLASFLQGQWSNLPPSFNDMVAMLILYALGLGIVLLLVWLGASNTGLSARAPDVDRLLGGLVGVACAVMIIAGLDGTLSMYFGYAGQLQPSGGSDWSASLYRAITTSQIGGAIHRSLLPALGSIAGPVLPIGFREALGAA